jgi:hypothetical protein
MPAAGARRRWRTEQIGTSRPHTVLVEQPKAKPSKPSPSRPASHIEPTSEPLSEPRRAARAVSEPRRAVKRATPSSLNCIYSGPRRPRPERLRRAPTTRPRRPRPERLRRASTTSTTRLRRNDDRREERRYDNRDHSHEDRSKNSRTGQLHCQRHVKPSLEHRNTPTTPTGRQ